MHRSIWIFAAGLFAIVAVANAATLKNTELADFQCKDNTHYLTYDPTSCDKYIECNNGQPEHKSCGIFYKFDEKTNKCIFHLWLIGSPDCSKVNPPSPTPTEGPTASPTGGPTNGPPSSSKPTKKSAAPVNSFSLSLGLFFLGALCFLS